MIIEIIILIFLLSILYALFIYRLIQANQLKKPILSVVSIFFVFVLVHYVFHSNLGYPINNNLPETFKLLHFHKSKNKIIMLITSNDRHLPRLHSLDYDLELEESLAQAMNDERAGKLLLGVTEKNRSDGVPSIKFREIKRNLPTK